jgi:hypothetical protein
VDIAFGALAAFFLLLVLDTEQNLDVDHLVKVSRDAVELLGDVIAQGGGNFQMVTADCQIHRWAPVALRIKNPVTRRPPVHFHEKPEGL